MPYEVRKNSDGKFCVHKQSDGSMIHCHETEEKAKAQMRALYANEDKSLNDILLWPGTELKSLGDGKFGGYLVRFTSVDDTDLVGDFFTKDTEFFIEDGHTLPVLYDHGLDPTLKRRKIGKATIKVDDSGLWLEGQLNLRDEYEKKIEELIAKGKAGLSSGAASHLTERQPVKSGQQMISWGIAEASITPTPCEPRNYAVTLKSYIAERDIKQLEEEPEEAKPLFDEVKDVLAASRFLDHLDVVLAAAEEVQTRAKLIHELRIKSGRVLSTANRSRLSKLLDSLSATSADIDSLLKETAPPEPEADPDRVRGLLASFDLMQMLGDNNALRN